MGNFIAELNKLTLCDGIETPDPVKALHFTKHVIPKTFNFFLYKKQSVKTNPHQLQYNRSHSCYLLLQKSSHCKDCQSLNVRVTSEINRKNVNLAVPAKLNAPVKFTSPERVKLALQQERLQCKQLEAEMLKMKSSITNCAEPISNQLSDDFKSIFSGADAKDVPPFMKLFWEEQQKYVKSSSASSVRYHPMIIKFCLNLASKSQSAYNELRYDKKTNSGVLILPSTRTLRDYKNYIRSTRGFNPLVISELGKKTADFQPEERFVSILLDEMKIQEDLVWDKNTGELIGYVDLGDIVTNSATLSNVKDIASHVLVFLVKSIVNPLSFSFATFGTNYHIISTQGRI